MRRELQVALLLVLAGSALLLVTAGRPWLVVALEPMPPLPGREQVKAGSELVPGLAPLGLVGLAGLAALAATRARGRVAVGVLLAAAGAGAVVATVRFLAGGAEPGTGTGWPYAAVGAGLLLGAGGLLVAARGRRWAAMSARYDAPAARAERPSRPEVAAWDALDRGEDPTAGPPAPGPPGGAS